MYREAPIFQQYYSIMRPLLIFGMNYNLLDYEDYVGR